MWHIKFFENITENYDLQFAALMEMVEYAQ